MLVRPGFERTASRSADRRLSHWANRAAVKALVGDATIIITFDSQAHVIQVHKYCTKWETFRFALPPWNLFSQEKKSRTWSQLSAGQSFGKVLVLAKSRNRFRLIAVQGFYTFILFQLCYVTHHPITLISFKLQWKFFYFISTAFSQWTRIEYSIE